MDDDASLNVLHFSWMVFYDCGAGRSKSHNIPEDAIFNLRDLENKKKNQSLKVPSVPDSFMNGYVIGMTAHSSSIEGQHLKQQNISLCG